MKIRKGDIKDFDEFYKILNSASELSGGVGKETYPKEFVKGTLTNKERELVLVAEEKGKIVGFLTAEIWKEKKYSFLIDVFVKPEFRKQGVASKLFETYEDFCKKSHFNSIVALVLMSNKRMQKWCKSHSIKQGDKFYYYQKNLK